MGPLIGKPGKPVFTLSFQCSSTVRSRIKSRAVPVPVTTTKSFSGDLAIDLQGSELRDGTIIREWHPQGRVPSKLGRRKTLTPFLLWRGPLVPTAPLNSSIGAGWITPASLRTKHRIGAGLRRFTQKTATDSWIFGGTCWILEGGEIEARLRRYDGEYRWFLFRAEPVRDNHGNIFKWYGANTDIEDRKRAEALLAAEKRTLEMIASPPCLAHILQRFT